MTSFTRFDSGSRGNNCFFQLRSDYKAPSDTDSLNEVSPSYPFSTPDRRFHARKKIALGSRMTLAKNSITGVPSYQKGGCIMYPLSVKKSGGLGVLVLLKVSSLIKSITGAFAVPLRVLTGAI